MPWARVGGGLLGTALLVVAVTRSYAQPPPAEPPAPRAEEVIPLPEMQITSRLPGRPLPLSSIPASVQVIPGSEIRESGAPSVQDYLQRLPGVTLQDEQGNSQQPDLTLRGFQASPVTGVPQGISVFLDGVRVNEPDAEEVNFDLLPLDEVERIEIVRGPSAIFGRNTLAAAVNIVTRRGAEVREIVPDLAGGSFGRQKYNLHLGGMEGPVDYYVAGTVFREDGYRDASSSRLNKAFGKVGLRGAGTDLTLSFQYADNRIEQAGSIPLSDLQAGRRAENFTPGDFFEPLLYFGTVNLRQELGEDLTLTANAFARQLNAEQFNVNFIAPNARTFTDTTSTGGTLQLSHRAIARDRENRLVVGVDYAHHEMSNTVFTEQNQNSLSGCVAAALAAGADPAAACPLKALGTKVFDTQDAVGPFVQDTLELFKGALWSGDSVVLTGAARWDWVRHAIVDRSPSTTPASATGVQTFDAVQPKIGINYNLSPDTGVYFSYSEGFRAPSFLELTCANPAALCPGLQAGTAPDPRLKSVTATTYEVGLRARPLSGLDGTVTVFRTDVANDIFSVAPTGTTAVFFSNIGATRRQGLEVGLHGSLPRWLDAYVNYTYTLATFQNGVSLFTPRLTAGCTTPPCTEFVRAGNDLPLIPNHRLNAGVDYHLTTWLTASLTSTFVGSQRLRGDEENVSRKLSDYVVVNGGLKAHWQRFEGALWIYNLFDTKYETFGTFGPDPKLAGAPVEPFLTPAVPINVLVSLSYRF
jgi:iron complex outermembrane recepter protein